jgi:hypothetical protein
LLILFPLAPCFLTQFPFILFAELSALIRLSPSFGILLFLSLVLLSLKLLFFLLEILLCLST